MSDTLLADRAQIALPKNIHGNSIVAVQGVRISGRIEVTRLRNMGYEVSEFAAECLTGREYQKHLLDFGYHFSVVLFSGSRLQEAERTYSAMRGMAAKDLRYSVPLAGIAPRLREDISDVQMKELGFDMIVVLSEPVIGPDASPNIFCINMGNRLDVLRSEPHSYPTFNDKIGFAMCDRHYQP